MFEARLKILLGVLAVASLVIVGRLAQLQVVRADYYRRRAEQSLLLKPKLLPFVRGSIVDRTGEVLVSDEPGWDLKIDYRVIAADMEEKPAAIKRMIKRWKRRYPYATTDAEVEQAFRRELASMWVEVAAVDVER